MFSFFTFGPFSPLCFLLLPTALLSGSQAGGRGRGWETGCVATLFDVNALPQVRETLAHKGLLEGRFLSTVSVRCLWHLQEGAELAALTTVA